MEQTKRGRHMDIPIGLLENNDGQIAGLPSNPREISNEDFKALRKNLKEVPRMLDARGLIVSALENGHYVVIGGNQRLRALREDGRTDTVPCFVLPEDTTPEEMKAMTILDNTQRGAWDWDKLANEWDAADLQDWGLPCWNGEEEAGAETQEEERELQPFNSCHVLISYSIAQHETVMAAIEQLRSIEGIEINKSAN